MKTMETHCTSSVSFRVSTHFQTLTVMSCFTMCLFHGVVSNGSPEGRQIDPMGCCLCVLEQAHNWCPRRSAPVVGSLLVALDNSICRIIINHIFLICSKYTQAVCSYCN